MQPHPYYQAIIDAYRLADRPYYHQLTAPEARAMLKAALAAAPAPTDLPALANIEDRMIDGPNGAIPVRLFHPQDPAGGTMVYFHSGGWVIGDRDTADASCRRLCGLARCTIVSVEYRKAPEHRYPVPFDDAYAAVAWAAANFPGALVVGGESSGGNLAAACALRARDPGGPAIAGQWLAYPVTDHDFDTPSYQALGTRNWLLSTADMRWFWDQYCPDVAQRSDPYVSPLRAASLAGLPAAMVIVAQLDPLRDEGLAYAARLAGDGVAVVTRCDPDMVHGYLAGAGAIAAAAQALAESGRWIRARLDAVTLQMIVGPVAGRVA